MKKTKLFNFNKNNSFFVSLRVKSHQLLRHVWNNDTVQIYYND